MPVPGRDAEGFCHLLSSMAPLKSFVCAKKETKIDGEYNNVVGFPVARVYQELKKRKLV